MSNNTLTRFAMEKEQTEANLSNAYLEEDDYDYWEYYNYILREKLPESLNLAYEYSVKYVTIVIWLLSLFGNIFIICIMLRKKNRVSAISTYLLSLAISDLMIGLDCLCISLETHNLRIFAWSDFGCKVYLVYYSVILSCSLTSAWTLVVMSINRLISVCIPHNVKSFCTVRNSRIIICLVWILSFVSGSSNAIYTYTTYYPNHTICYFEENDLVQFANFYVFFIIFMDMYIPIITVSISSLIIIIFLYKRTSSVSKSKISQKLKSATVIIITANAIFLVTNIPYSVYVFYSTFQKETVSLEEYLYLLTIEQILLVCKDFNCALNFYMYFLAGPSFRRQSKEIIVNCYLRCRDMFKGVFKF